MRAALKVPVWAGLVGIFIFGQAALADFTLPETSVTTSGGVTLTSGGTFSASQTSDLIKLSGGATLSSNGTAGTINFTANGNVSADAGERLRVSYDVSFDLSGGTADYTVGGTFTQPLPFPFPPLTLSGSDGGSLTGPLNQHFVGSFETPPLPLDIDGSYSVALTVNWTGAAGDTISIVIPTQSIDLAIVAVPEPSAAIGGIILAAAMLRRRR